MVVSVISKLGGGVAGGMKNPDWAMLRTVAPSEALSRWDHSR